MFGCMQRWPWLCETVPHGRQRRRAVLTSHARTLRPPALRAQSHETRAEVQELMMVPKMIVSPQARARACLL
jgi:hypothetical protein